MIRAVIFDIYGTLLDITPPPENAESQWQALWDQAIGTRNPPSLAELDSAVRTLIPSHHAAARTHGVVQPEIDWPALAEAAFPDLARLPPEKYSHFWYAHARLCRTTRLADGAADCLRALLRAGHTLGLASNAQACTRQELAAALDRESLSFDVFHPHATFLSYEHRLAKPDPGVFAFLSRQLARLGIAPASTLMVGDRSDTDIAPALAAKWQTWHLTPFPTTAHSGPWPDLQSWLAPP